MTGINIIPQILASSNQFLYQRLAGDAKTGEGLKKINSLIERFRQLQSQPQNEFGVIINQISSRFGVDPNLVNAVIQVESEYKSDAVSPAGAQGLMQLMPQTAEEMGVDDSFNPAQNIEGGVKYLYQLLSHFDGNTSLALAAYNAGPGAVMEYGGIPPYQETQVYVNKVLQAYQANTAGGK